MKRILNVVFAAMTITSLSACVIHTSTSNPKNVSTMTLGQELADLKTALDEGAISESEYRAAKELLIAGHPHPDPKHDKHH